MADNARLHLSAEEVDQYTNELTEMFEYVKKIQEINTDDVKPTKHGNKVSHILRSDVPKKWDLHREALKNAPKTDDNQFKVPTVIE